MARSPMTPTARLMLRALMASPGREMYGLEIVRAASVASGTVYPLLARLEAEGWVSSRAEAVDPQAQGRPARRYFKITEAGEAAAREAFGREAARLAALGIADAPPEDTPPAFPVAVDKGMPPGTIKFVVPGQPPFTITGLGPDHDAT